MATFSLCCFSGTNKEEKEGEEDVFMDRHFFYNCYNTFNRRKLYVMLTGNDYYCPYWDNRNLIKPNFQLRRFNNDSDHGLNLVHLLYHQGYLSCKEDQNRRFRVPNQQGKDRFVKELIELYIEEYGINEENIKECSNAFVDLFSSFGEEDELEIAMHNIKRKVQDLVPEKILSKLGTEGKYGNDLLDIMFLPLFQTGFKCTLWYCEEVDIILHNEKCAVVMKLQFSQEDNSIDCLRSIYNINPPELSGFKDVFPNGVKEYLVMVIIFNVDMKAVTISSSYERNCDSPIN